MIRPTGFRRRRRSDVNVPRRLRRFVRRFGLARAFCLILLVSLAALRISDPHLVEELRLRAFDAYQVVDPRVKEAKPVTIVDLDEASLARYGQWPWPRTRVAELVTTLRGMGAIVIAFDVMFAEPDRLNPAAAADVIAGLDEDTKARLRALPSNDQMLADAISGARIVLGETGLPSLVPQPEQPLPVTGLAMLGEDPQSFMFEFAGLLRNIPILEQAAAGRGILTIRPERDGIVRRVPMIVVAQNATMPSLSLEVLRVLTGTETILVRSNRAGITGVAVKGFEVPTDANGQLWIHFARRDPSIYVSAADVLDGRVLPEAVARKLVLIGTSAAGLLDTKTTPIDRVMPGVEIHAQVLESMLTRSVLSQPNNAIGAELIAAILLGILIIWVAPLAGPGALLVLGTLITGVMINLSWYFYVWHRLLIDLTYPLGSSLLIYLTLVFSSFMREQAQRRQIRSAFSQYLSPALVEQLAQSPERLVLGGEEREMTFMLSDVRGFTSISETFKNDPRGLTALMNRFLTPLTNAILGRKGTIDKYMGDAIMAFWNAPLDDKDHQVNACMAALDMLDKLEALNLELEEEAEESGRPFIPLRIGVGLNTGKCLVGNLGSDVHFNYSVLGDSVNVASRLEAQSKVYGFPIIAGGETALAARNDVAILELDFVIVKGKTQPDPVYAIVGRKEFGTTAEFKRLQALVAQLIECYRGRNWEGALQVIERGRQNSEAGRLGMLLDLYSERIHELRSNPPPDNWNGAYQLLTK
jgi:adenylate cyclase